MSLKSFPAALALAVAALAASAPAAASTTIALAPGGGGLAGSFTQLANGLVIDDYGFSPAAFDATVSVTLASVSGPVSFFTAAFFPDTAAEIDFQNLTNGVGGTFSFAAPVTSSMPLTLRVFGAVTDGMGNLGGDGSYSVSITTAAAVPEPHTYVLLLAGLVGIGVAGRRRAG